MIARILRIRPRVYLGPVGKMARQQAAADYYQALSRPDNSGTGATAAPSGSGRGEAPPEIPETGAGANYHNSQGQP